MSALDATVKRARRGGIAAGVVIAASIGLLFVPLFGGLGFEFVAAIGALLTYVAGLRAAGAAARARGHGPVRAERDPRAFPGRALLRAIVSNLSLALLPLAVILIDGLRTPICNLREGLAFYAILPLPGIVYGTAVGFGLGLAWPPRRARAAFVGWSLVTLASALAWLVLQPPKFAYSTFIGYFPGPIYDAEIPVTRTLLLARGVVVLQAGLAVALSVLAWDGTRVRARRLMHDWDGERAVAAAGALGLALVWLLVELNAAALGLRLQRRDIRRILGGHIETAHCHLYFDRAAFSDLRVERFAREHETRYAQLEAWFGFAPQRKIGSYIYASPEQKKRLMGAGGTSFEDALHDEFHIHASAADPHPVLTHEMAHIFAAQFHRWMKVSLLMGLHEGIAVAAEWNEESARFDLTPHQACAAMDSLGILPDLQRSLGTFGFWTQPGARAYTAAGSFVRWLIETYGMDRFRIVWPRGDFERAYAKPLATLLAEWRTLLRGVAVSPVEHARAARLFRARSIFQVPCAHERARVDAAADQALARGDWARAESLYVRSSELAPEDSEVRLDLARVRLRRGDAAGAAMSMRTALREDATADAALRLAADAAWGRGRYAEADSLYARGLQLSGIAAERRAHEAARTALQDPALRDLLRSYLTDMGTADVAGLALLAHARAMAPRAALPRYLLGRRLVLAGEFGPALEELVPLRADSTLGPRLRWATEDLVGRTYFHLGDTDSAQEIFGGLLERAAGAGDRFSALDWLDRCRYSKVPPKPAKSPLGQ